MSHESPSPADVLRHYPSRYGTAAEVRPVAGGFSGANVYRVSGEAGEFCLRGWPPEALPPARIAGLHRLLRWIHERDVAPVPVPVAASAGETVIRVGDRLWQLEPWMPGEADFHRQPTAERLRAATRSLAAWHRAAATFEARPDERPWFARSHGGSPAVAERLELLRQWREGKLESLRTALRGAGDDELPAVARDMVRDFDRAADDVAGQLRAVGRVAVPLQPCLRDVWHDHVLFTGDAVTGLIDAAACRTESVAADLARLLGSLVADDWPAWQVALDEYQRHRPLALDELALVPVLDRSGVLLSGLTWLDRLFLQHRRCEPLAPILQRLHALAARLRRLAAG